MTTRLDQRGWTAAHDLAPCVVCHQPAIMRSPRGKPCNWTCALAWADEHQDQDQDHEPERGKAGCTMASPCHRASCGACYPEQYHVYAYDKCPACKGGGLVPTPGCTCNPNAR